MATVRRLVPLNEYNEQRAQLRAEMEMSRRKTGLACPDCGQELQKSYPGTLCPSSPPQQWVECPGCGCRELMLA